MYANVLSLKELSLTIAFLRRPHSSDGRKNKFQCISLYVDIVCSYLVQLIDKFGRKLARNQANRLSNSFAILKRLHDTTRQITPATQSRNSGVARL